MEAGWLGKAEKLSQCCYGSPEEYGGQTHRWVVRTDSPARAQSPALHFGGGEGLVSANVSGRRQRNLDPPTSDVE